MRNHVPILIIVVLISIVGVSAYVTMSTPQDTHNETVDLLNKSGKVHVISSYAEFKGLFLNISFNFDNSTIKNNNNTNIISETEVIQSYENIFKNYWGTSDVEVELNGISYTPDGKPYYVVTVTKKNGNSEKIIFFSLADVKPVEKAGQQLDIDGVYEIYVLSNTNNQNNPQPALTKEQITQMAKEEYAKYNPQDNSATISTQLYYAGQDPIYSVIINNNATLEYQGNTGELLYSSLTGQTNDTDYSSICQKIAQDRLNQENSPYKNNLSIKFVKNQTEPEGNVFYYDIIFKDDHGQQTIGQIVVEAITKQVLSFQMSEPVIAPTEENTTDTTPNDTSSQPNEPSSSSSSSHTPSSHSSSSESSSSGGSSGGSSSSGSSGSSGSGSSSSSGSSNSGSGYAEYGY